MDLDNLLALPTRDDEQTGGGIDENFVILTRDEIEAKKEEAFFNIHTTPIILTEKITADKKEIADVTDFLSSTGLQITDILAFNGEAVRKLITNPRDTGKGINEKLFLLKKGQTYESVSDLVEKQVAFICLFHHLFFLAKLTKTPNFPMFTDSFSDKFNAIQKSVQEIKNIKIDEGNTSTVSGAMSQTTSQGFRNISMTEGSQGPPVSSSIFGIDFKNIATFWSGVQSDISLADMVEVFKMSPTELYNWFTSDVKLPAVQEKVDVPAVQEKVDVPAVEEKVDVPAVQEKVDVDTATASVGTKMSIVSGTKLPPEAVNIIDEAYKQSGHEEAPPEIAPQTANAAIIDKPRRSRRAKIAAVDKMQKMVAESRSRNTAATLKHKAVNNLPSPTE